MANFHPDLYVWLCKNYKEQPEKAQELMNFLGAASMVECQVYPVNSKYHMNLVGVPMTLQSRRQDYKLLTGSKNLISSASLSSLAVSFTSLAYSIASVTASC